jgi:hypothetical protein
VPGMKSTGVRCQRPNNLRFRGFDSCLGGEFITLYRQERQVRNVGVSCAESDEDTALVPARHQRTHHAARTGPAECQAESGR